MFCWEISWDVTQLFNLAQDIVPQDIILSLEMAASRQLVDQAISQRDLTDGLVQAGPPPSVCIDHFLYRSFIIDHFV